MRLLQKMSTPWHRDMRRSVIDLQEEHGTKPHRILKLVNTRWLSLNQCVERSVQQWIPLREFFKLGKGKYLSKTCKGSKGKHTNSTSTEKSVNASAKPLCPSTKTIISGETSTSSTTKPVSCSAKENASTAKASLN